MKKFLALAALALGLAACQDAPVSNLTPVTVTNKSPLRVNVAQINVVENYRSSSTAPNIELTIPTPPVMALKKWTAERLVAAGQQGALEVIIDDASMREPRLPVKDGLTGFFTDQQEARYDASIKVTFRLYDGVDTISIAEGTVSASQMRTINQKASVAQREAMFNQMIQNIMLTFDSEAELRLRQNFGRWIMY